MNTSWDKLLQSKESGEAIANIFSGSKPLAVHTFCSEMVMQMMGEKKLPENALELTHILCMASQLFPEKKEAFDRCVKAHPDSEECVPAFRDLAEACDKSVAKEARRGSSSDMSAFESCQGESDFHGCVMRRICPKPAAASESCLAKNGGNASACRKPLDASFNCFGDFLLRMQRHSVYEALNQKKDFE